MDAADVWFTRSLEGARALSNRRDLAAARRLGRIALLRGDHGHASASLEESLRLWRSLADRIRQAQVLVMLGRMEQSPTRLNDALRLYTSVDHKLGISVQTLEEMACLSALNREAGSSIPGVNERCDGSIEGLTR